MKNRIPVFILLFLLIGVFGISVYRIVSIRAVQAKEDTAFRNLSEMVEQRRNQQGRDTEDFIETAEQSVIAQAKDMDASDKNNIPVLLPEYKELYKQNPDLFGWISIEGTEINYPVMYTPRESEYYLRRAFDGSNSQSGTPFVDGACKVSGNFYLIYGHNMKNKTMFGMLPNYADPGWYEEHAVIRFDTLYERREYEVMAVFYADATESGSENRFRYYEYTDLSEQSVFEEYVAQVNAAALYDTGVTVVYGDELITLSTCSYHTSDGRFVVVAKRIN